MSLIPVPLKLHPSIAGISPGCKGLAFARISKAEQKSLFAEFGDENKPSHQAI
jgi:hypothetical protein